MKIYKMKNINVMYIRLIHILRVNVWQELETQMNNLKNLKFSK